MRYRRKTCLANDTVAIQSPGQDSHTTSVQKSFKLRFEAPSARPVTLLAVKIVLLLFSLVVFFFSPVLQVGDSHYSLLLSEALYQYRSPFLDRYTFPGPIADESNPVRNLASKLPHTRQLGRVNGHVLYLYPHGSS